MYKSRNAGEILTVFMWHQPKTSHTGEHLLGRSRLRCIRHPGSHATGLKAIELPMGLDLTDEKRGCEK